MVQLSLKTVAIGLVWFGVIVFAFIITIIRKRRNQGQTTISPLDMTHAKKAKQVEIAKELLLMKVRETTTTFQRFEATGDQQDDDLDCDIEKGESDEAERTDGLSYSNACAVCLEEFEQGENIVRSVETKGCPHIFHESCMVEVISAAAKKQILHIPCPCCRQTFVEIEEVANA